MTEFLEQAKRLEDFMVSSRRYLHQHAELGCDLPKTASFVKEKLKEIGLEPKEICQSGILAEIKGARPGKTILLRADMDALPMEEESGLSFHTRTNAAHTCGHDLHTSMLLGAAKILYDNRDTLCGTVKLMFQPGEEVGIGARNMIDAGILENPRVDAAFGMHVMFGWKAPAFAYGSGFTTSFLDEFEITIKGVGCHGAMPHLGIDPINVGFHIYTAYQALVAREMPPKETASLTIGRFTSGTRSNVMPDRAVMEGTMRTYDRALRERMLKRLEEVAKHCGEMFHADVTFRWLSNIPAIESNPELSEEFAGCIREYVGDFIKSSACTMTFSDDFGFVAEKVPSSFFMVGCKVDGCEVQHHNPKVLFDESVLVYGAAAYAGCAHGWLLQKFVKSLRDTD